MERHEPLPCREGDTLWEIPACCWFSLPSIRAYAASIFPSSLFQCHPSPWHRRKGFEAAVVSEGLQKQMLKGKKHLGCDYIYKLNGVRARSQTPELNSVKFFIHSLSQFWPRPKGDLPDNSLCDLAQTSNNSSQGVCRQPPTSGGQ